MSQFGTPSDQGVIRITPEDVASPHVDDLLKRQASLRGERGIAADRRKRWYYQSWFIFMIAGTLGAVVAWGAIEPYFNDTLYLQGTIEQIELLDPPSSQLDLGNGFYFELPGPLRITGEMRTGGNRVVLLSETRPVDAEDDQQLIDPKSLSAGDEVGLYVEPLDVGAREPLALALFVDTAPRPGSTTFGTLKQAASVQTAAGLLLFPLVAALIGFFVGAADGLVCRLWRRLVVAGIVGLVVGLLGGFLASILAGLIYAPLNRLAVQQMAGPGQFTAFGFLTQMSGRGLGWCVAGMAMGLGQGIALRSGRLLLYGFLGGAIGGLLGGLLFDPIDLLLLGTHKPSAHVSRMIGIAVIGGTVGVMIGVVELLARDAWLNMVKGPLAGKEFLIFKDLLHVGASPRSDIYLFNDQQVAEHHALVRATADHYEIEAIDPMYPVLLNGRPVERARLRHGDLVTLGQTVFSFHRRRTE